MINQPGMREAMGLVWVDVPAHGAYGAFCAGAEIHWRESGGLGMFPESTLVARAAPILLAFRGRPVGHLIRWVFSLRGETEVYVRWDKDARQFPGQAVWRRLNKDSYT